MRADEADPAQAERQDEHATWPAGEQPGRAVGPEARGTASSRPPCRCWRARRAGRAGTGRAARTDGGRRRAAPWRTRAGRAAVPRSPARRRRRSRRCSVGPEQEVDVAGEALHEGGAGERARCAAHGQYRAQGTGDSVAGLVVAGAVAAAVVEDVELAVAHEGGQRAWRAAPRRARRTSALGAVRRPAAGRAG